MKDLCKNPLLRKRKKMFIIDQYKYVTSGSFTITTDQSSLQTVGINFTFTGNLSVDWDDGSAIENFVSGVELTHDYGSTGTYNIEISGNLTNITKFIADNCRITTITGIKTGLLTDLRVWGNLLSGTLDLSDAPISGTFLASFNSNLTGITFASSGNNTVNILHVNDSGLTGILDLSNVPISDNIFTYNCTSLTGITFASSGNGKLSDARLYNCNLTGTLDLSNMPISGLFWAYSNSNLTDITYASLGNTIVNNFNIELCDITETHDLSNVPVSGLIILRSNSNLTGITFASSGNGTVTGLRVNNCDLTGTLDLSNLSLSTLFYCYVNPNLTDVTFPSSGNGAITIFSMFSCALSNKDFSVFPTSNGATIRLYSNSLTATEHDNQLINLDNTGWINGTLTIITGNTARTSASDTAYNNLIANGWTIV